jgi:hypothetical protein
MILLTQRIRTLGIDFSCWATEWNSEHILSPDCFARDGLGEPTLRERLGWWIETQLTHLFGFFWNGSEEELDAVANGEIPRKYMSQRQREFGREAALIAGIFYDDCFCADCESPLQVADISNVCAHCRALHPEMLLEDRK